MRLLYATDIHGHHAKYRKLLEIAKEEGVRAVVNGGDMWPKIGDLLSEQRRFLREWLGGWMMQVAESGIELLVMPGNDDLTALDAEFDGLCRQHPLIHNLARRMVKIGDYEFVGMDLVCDYPFRLKDRCRLDFEDVLMAPQFGSGLTTRSGRFEEIEDWPRYAMGLPKMNEELEALPKPADARRAVYVIHQPPLGMGLDMLTSGQLAGSASVSRFLLRQRPLLSLHGHIHESPDCSGVWHAQVEHGDCTTHCIQPGQRKDLVYVLLDLENMTANRRVVGYG